MKLLQLLDGVETLGGNAPLETEISGVCYDSRKAAAGCLFVAVRGFASDGHQFIPAAAERGAAVALVETPPENGTPYILVKNSRRALAQVGANWYGHPEKALRITGVTGTNGKTTTTHLICHILGKNGVSCGMIGTNGVMIGGEMRPSGRTTPESLDLYGLLAEMRDAGCTDVVMEVSSHSLALDRVWGLHFAAAAFTNLTQDHLDFHGDMEHYFQAKSLLFSRCDTAVINLDDSYGARLAEQTVCQKLYYSVRNNRAELLGRDVRLLPEGVRLVVVHENELSRMSLGIPGMFSVYNGLAAIGCCLALGISLEQIAPALQSAKGVKGRAEIVPTGKPFTVMIDYSHTPDSMENILKTVRGYAQGRVIGLFGAGGDRDRTKRPIMGRIGAQYSDLCIVTSDNPRSEDPQAIINDILAGIPTRQKVRVIPDRREAIAWAVANARENDIIVLMGKGHETYQEIAGVKHHLDEREEVAKALQALRS